MKRFFATLIGSGTVAALTVTASAWAGPGGLGLVGTDDPVKRAAAKTCLEEARTANPDADKDAIREAAKPCLTAAGIEVREPTPEQKARRQAIGDCMKKAKEANPDAERPAIHEAVKACLAEAGITLPERPEGAGPGGAPGGRGPGGREPRELTPEQQAKRDAARKCIDDARTANPDADKEAVHEAARACLEAAGVPVPPAPTAEQKAARETARECMKTAREANPGDTREAHQAVRTAVKACLDAAGIEPGDLGRFGGPGHHGPGPGGPGPDGRRIDPGERGETEATPTGLQQ